MSASRSRSSLTSHVPTSAEQCTVKFERGVFGSSADELEMIGIVKDGNKYKGDNKGHTCMIPCSMKGRKISYEVEINAL